MASRPTLRQIEAVIAVCEEGSFTRAAERERATQSGISQHVAAVEKSLGLKLFERTPAGIRTTAAGRRFYRHCVGALGLLDHAGQDLRSAAGGPSGELRIGLMPTFTRAALAPALESFVPAYPDIRLHLVEGYSALLTDMVLADALDFAIVPAFEGRTGLKSRILLRDREVLLSGPRRGFKPLKPLRLADCGPLKIVVPGPGNVRRRTLEIYFETHDVEIEQRIEMDAMIATLEFIARTDWVTILPGLICVNDIGKKDIVVNPIVEPQLLAEFVVITPARRTLGMAARLFLQNLERELSAIGKTLQRRLNFFPVLRRRGKSR
jgi:LysR family tcuABC transcriptional regulator